MRACAFRGAKNGAEIVRIRKLIAQDDQRRLSLCFGGGQNLVDGCIAVHGDGSDNALMRAGEAHLVEPAAVNADDDGARILRHRGKTAQGPVGVAVGQKDLVDRPSAADCFRNGVAALDHIRG